MTPINFRDEQPVFIVFMESREKETVGDYESERDSLRLQNRSKYWMQVSKTLKDLVKVIEKEDKKEDKKEKKEVKEQLEGKKKEEKEMNELIREKEST